MYVRLSVQGMQPRSMAQILPLNLTHLLGELTRLVVKPGIKLLIAVVA